MVEDLRSLSSPQPTLKAAAVKAGQISRQSHLHTCIGAPTPLTPSPNLPDRASADRASTQTLPIGLDCLEQSTGHLKELF